MRSTDLLEITFRLSDYRRDAEAKIWSPYPNSQEVATNIEKSRENKATRAYFLYGTGLRSQIPKLL